MKFNKIFVIVALFCIFSSSLSVLRSKYEFKFTVEDFTAFMRKYGSQNPELLYTENSTEAKDLKSIKFVMGEKKAEEGQIKLENCSGDELPSWGSPLKEKQFSWYKVLTTLSTNDRLMKRMLVFRYRVMLSIILKSIEEYFVVPRLFLEGDFKKFKSNKIAYTPKTIGTNVVSLPSKDGFFQFENLGSANNDSDIDLVVEFIYEDPSANNSITYKIDPTQKLIQTWNKYFEIYKSSLNAFDVNLYSGDFSLESLVEIHNGLNEKDKTTFKNANRLSVLALIYRDSFSRIKEEYKPNMEGVEGKLNLLLNKLGVCSSIMFDDKKILKRKSDLSERNINMRASLVDAISAFNTANTLEKDKKSFKTEHLKLLCHVLRSNYEANEAYVPFGSVLDIKKMQGKLIAGRELYHNELVDSILMNFAYLVEHFYKNKTVDSESYLKFGKYLGRIYYSVADKIEPAELVCWKEKIELYDSGVKSTERNDIFLGSLRKYLTTESQKRFNDKETKNSEIINSSTLINNLYQCVSDYAFDVVSSSNSVSTGEQKKSNGTKMRKLKLKLK